MQEQQGNLEEPLSGLPGPRPFNKNNKKGVPMEDSNNKELNDIVARATEHLSSGKAFGGWTDKVEDLVKEAKIVTNPQLRLKLGKGVPAGGGRSKKDKSGTLKGLMSPEKKGTKVGVLSHVEHDGEFVDESSAARKAHTRKLGGYKYGTGPKSEQGGAKHKGKPAKGADQEDAVMNRREREGAKPQGDSFANKGKWSERVYRVRKSQKARQKVKDNERRKQISRAIRPDRVARYAHVEHDGASLDEKVATKPRQLKDKKKEMLVHDSKGKVTTIDKKDLKQYQKDNPGSGVAEGVGQIGGAVREGWKGAAAGAAGGAAIGSAVPVVGTAIGAILGGLAGYAGGEVVGAAGRSMIGAEKKKKKTWQDK